MAATRKKKGNPKILNLEQIFAEAMTIWKNIEQAVEEKNYGATVVNLIALANKIGEVSPELAPAMGAIIDNYGAAAKPFFDQFFASGAKTAGYFHGQMAEAKKNLLPQLKKHVEANAQIYAMRLKALQFAGFNREEAMDIILAEICGAKMSRKSLIDPSSIKLPTRK